MASLGVNIEPAAPVPAVKTPKEPRVRIILEENENIPPTGLFIGRNGVSYMLRAGEPVEVPQGVIEILDAAVESRPVIDPGSRRPTGYRNRHRFPYRRVLEG